MSLIIVVPGSWHNSCGQEPCYNQHGKSNSFQTTSPCKAETNSALSTTTPPTLSREAKLAAAKENQEKPAEVSQDTGGLFYSGYMLRWGVEHKVTSI
jgi:hypothetical protein